jgi:hypothetical protein
LWCYYNTYHSMCYTPCWSMNHLSYAPKYQSFIPNPIPTKFCSHVLNYSTCKCANWVLQAFLKPSLVPKCDIYYLKNKCCYTYSNSIVVALSPTYVIYFTWAFLKLIHALMKHKDFINYFMPNPILPQIILISPN